MPIATPTGNGAIHVMRATVWHGGLRKHQWAHLMNAGFDRAPGIAEPLLKSKLELLSNRTVSLPGNGPRVMMRNPMRRIPALATNERSAVAYGRNERSPRNKRPRSPATCSIGCGHWVSRRLIPSAQSRGRGGSAGPSRCMQQTLIGLFINRYEFGRLL